MAPLESQEWTDCPSAHHLVLRETNVQYLSIALPCHIITLLPMPTRSGSIPKETGVPISEKIIIQSVKSFQRVVLMNNKMGSLLSL